MQKVKDLFAYIEWLYTQYSLVTALNILDAYEMRLFNCCVLLVIGIFIYSSYLFLPAQIASIVHAIF